MLLFSVPIIILLMTMPLYVLRVPVSGAKLLFWLVALILVFATTFRVAGGSDYNVYLGLWKSTEVLSLRNSAGDYSYMEVGFRFLLSILKVVGSSPFVYNFFMILMPVWTLWIVTRKLGSDYLVSMFVFFTAFYIPYFLNAIGQGLTMMLFLYIVAGWAWPNNRSWRGLWLAILSPLLHKSGLFIFLTFVFRRVMSVKNMLIFSILVLFMNFLALPTMALSMSPLLETIVNYGFINAVSPLDYVYRLALVALVLVLWRYYFPDDKFFCLMSAVYIFGFAIFLLLADFGEVALRVSLFFRSLEIIIFPYAASRLLRVSNRIVFSVLMVVIYSPIWFINASNPINSLFF